MTIVKSLRPPWEEPTAGLLLPSPMDPLRVSEGAVVPAASPLEAHSPGQQTYQEAYNG